LNPKTGQQTKADLDTPTLPQEKRVTVFYEVYDEPLMTVGRTTIIGQL
jgi:hypothetical protein